MKKIFSILGIAIILSAGFLFLNSRDFALGSAVVGNDYYSYEVKSSVGSTTPVVLKVGNGSLGSVVIASSTTAGIFSIHDNASATTTASSTKIVQFNSSAAGGTYTFDREVNLGLVLSVPVGFTGEFVVTYR